MACTHPSVFIEHVTREDGAHGIRCQSCRRTAYEGDSFWTVVQAQPSSEGGQVVMTSAMKAFRPTWRVWQWRMYRIHKGWEWGWLGQGWNVLRLGKVQLWV